MDSYEQKLIGLRDKYKLLELKYTDKRTTRPWTIRAKAYENALKLYREFPKPAHPPKGIFGWVIPKFTKSYDGPLCDLCFRPAHFQVCPFSDTCCEKCLSLTLLKFEKNQIVGVIRL